jgi:hypothetical protein
MKVLITGMGSHHCKRPDNVSFFTLLADSIAEFADVTWMSPSTSWTFEDLDKYDQIIFGFMPPTSLSANKLYGALNVLGLMFESPKLKLVLDSPQVWQYRNSIKAVVRNPQILLGAYYSKREGYTSITANQGILSKVSDYLSGSTWPTIIYPSLPWNSDEKVASLLGFASVHNLVGINLDASLLDLEPTRIGRLDVWAVENPKSSWLQGLYKTLVFPQLATKIGRKTDDEYALSTIRGSVGLILPPQERNSTTWWNYRVIQALNTSTPIATYWPDTKDFSAAWAVLAYQIEDMSPAERQALAATQRDVYFSSISSKEESLRMLEHLLIDSAKERI